jgi:hypothetical protein
MNFLYHVGAGVGLITLALFVGFCWAVGRVKTPCTHAGDENGYCAQCGVYKIDCNDG